MLNHQLAYSKRRTTVIELDFVFTEEGDYSHKSDKYDSASYLGAAHGLIVYGRINCYINDIGFGPGEGAILGFATEKHFSHGRIKACRAIEPLTLSSRVKPPKPYSELLPIQKPNGKAATGPIRMVPLKIWEH